MNAFWTLVKNDIKFKEMLKFKKPNWLWVYFTAAVLIGLTQYTFYLVNAKEFKVDTVYIVPMFIFIFILTSGKIIDIEWRRNSL